MVNLLRGGVLKQQKNNFSTCFGGFLIALSCSVLYPAEIGDFPNAVILLLLTPRFPVLKGQSHRFPVLPVPDVPLCLE